MSKLYDDVKKQEQIDDLQKTVTNHGTRIETLETKAKATPPQAVNQGPITVKLPDNIATNESVGKLLDEKLPATSTDGTLKKSWSNCRVACRKELRMYCPTIWRQGQGRSL